MTGVSFEVTFDDSLVMNAFARVEADLARPAGLLWRLGAYGVDSTVRRFGEQAAPDGSPWAPLMPAYASLKPSGYDILYLTGALRTSQHFVVGAGEVQWGSGMIYAAVHQFGATIVPKSAKALHFQLGLGGVREVFAKSVTIPARPYLGLSAADRVEIPRIAGDYIRTLL
jgi:phage gpG-like protein